MKENFNNTIPEEGVKNYLQDYFQAKMLDEGGFDASRIHVYASAEDAKLGKEPVNDMDLRVMVRSGQNFFVKYDDKEEIVPFTARGSQIFSGQDMADLLTQEIQNLPDHSKTEPANTDGPGFWANLMYRFFNYKTDAYREYEGREADRRLYKQEQSLRDVRSLANSIDEDGLDLELAEVRRGKAPQSKQAEKSVEKVQAAEKAPADIDISENLKIGDAAPKEPKAHEAAATVASTMADGYIKKTPRYNQITEYLEFERNEDVKESLINLIHASKENYDAAKKDLEEAIEGSFFLKPKNLTVDEVIQYAKNQPDLKMASDLRKASGERSQKEREELYTISEEEYNKYFKEQDAENWRKLDNGKYVDTVHEKVMEGVLPKDPNKKTANRAAADNGVHLTAMEKEDIHEEVDDNRLHNELLGQLWSDRKKKIEQDKEFIVNTIVDGFVKPGQEAEREALSQQVAASSTLEKMLHETDSSLNMTLKLAQNDPKALQDTFVEKLKENSADKLGNVAEQSKNVAKKIVDDKKNDKKPEVKPVDKKPMVMSKG